MPQDLFRQASLLLDFMGGTGRGWEDVATELAIGDVLPVDVSEFKNDISQSPSATIMHLYFEFTRQQSTSTLHTLTNLHRICHELDIQDAKKIFERAISDKNRPVPENSETSVSCHNCTGTSTVSDKQTTSGSIYQFWYPFSKYINFNSPTSSIDTIIS